jgi:hypothetical protein
LLPIDVSVAQSTRPQVGATKKTSKCHFFLEPIQFTSGFHYSLFTAADEKIALSVVRVNRKPQYLVFGVHFLHTPSKHKSLRVESSKRPGITRGN